MADRDDILHTFGRALAVTPSDATALSPFAKKLYVGGAGNLKITTPAGDVVTFTAVPVGTVLPVKAQLVWSTGTTATAIVALS